MKRLLFALVLAAILIPSAFAQTTAPAAPEQGIATLSGRSMPIVYNDGTGGHANVVAVQKRGWVPLG